MVLVWLLASSANNHKRTGAIFANGYAMVAILFLPIGVIHSLISHEKSI